MSRPEALQLPVRKLKTLEPWQKGRSKPLGPRYEFQARGGRKKKKG